MDEETEEEEKTYENYALPPPPPYYKHFTEKNLQRLKDLTEAAEDGDTAATTLLDLPPELRCLLPPEPPEDGIVTNFGEPKTNHDFLRTLADMEIPQLYPDPTPQTADTSQWTHERAKYLKILSRSIMMSFMELIGLLAVNPPQAKDKSEHLQRLFQNALHLINEYRPHQARESLITMMEKQIQKLRDEIDKVKEMEKRVNTLMAGLGKEETEGTSAPLPEDPKPVSAEELWKREQRAVWAALDEELGH